MTDTPVLGNGPGPPLVRIPAGKGNWLAAQRLVPSELLGLPADGGKNALIAGRLRDGGEYAVECLSDDR